MYLKTVQLSFTQVAVLLVRHLPTHQRPDSVEVSSVVFVKKDVQAENKEHHSYNQSYNSNRNGQPKKRSALKKKKKEKVSLNRLNSASFYPSSHCVRSGNRATFGKDSTGRHKVTNHFTYSLDRKSNLL